MELRASSTQIDPKQIRVAIVIIAIQNTKKMQRKISNRIAKVAEGCTNAYCMRIVRRIELTANSRRIFRTNTNASFFTILASVYVYISLL